MFRYLTKNPTNILVNVFRSSNYKTNGPFPMRSSTTNQAQSQGYVTKDAERVFQQFFKENPPKQSEKSFFDMSKNNYEETIAFDPFNVLQISPGSSIQKIDQAYRRLALKYHPKNNSSFQASQKFINIARAYEMLNPKNKKISKKSYQFMDDFNNSVKSILGNQIGVIMTKEKKGNERNLKTAQLYSQSKNIKKFGNEKEITIEKQYNNNGNLIKIKIVETHKQDGTIQVKEIFDNGLQLKENEFVKQR